MLRPLARRVRLGLQGHPILTRIRCRGFERAHLGCGAHVLAGWANIDLTPGTAGVWRWDLRRGVPFADQSLRFVFTEHMIEHVPRVDAGRLLRDCRRALRPGGVIRISTPDLAQLLDCYRSGTIDLWRDLGWMPETPCRMMNEALRLWGHQFIYDEAELRGLLEECGFRDPCRRPWRESPYPELRGLERRPWKGDLIMEAIRAG